MAAALVPTFGYQPIVLAAAIMFGGLAALAWTFTETNGKQLETAASEASG
jgi:hypothetical protein